jgi:hypothetical protein
MIWTQQMTGFWRKLTALYLCRHQVCQIFLGTTYKIGKNINLITTKCTKWLWNVPNGRKLYQMLIKHTNIFNRNSLQNLPKLGFLIRKYTIWQPWKALLHLRTSIWSPSNLKKCFLKPFSNGEKECFVCPVCRAPEKALTQSGPSCYFNLQFFANELQLKQEAGRVACTNIFSLTCDVFTFPPPTPQPPSFFSFFNSRVTG